MAGRSFDFEYWDVFSRIPLKGNPLCVFPNVRGLSNAEMRGIARETNLSETTFVLPGNHVRIWTTVEELPFAGHPTLGTAMALRKPGMPRIVLEEKIGPVPVRFEDQPDGFVYGEMSQPDPVFAEEHPPAVIADLLRVAAADLAPGIPIVNVSTGRPNLIVLFKSLRAVKSLNPDWSRIQTYFGANQRGFYFLTPETETPGAKFHARKLTPRTEDPVTGSAAGSAVSFLVRYGLARPGERFVIEQGAEVHRAGELHVAALRQGEKVTGVTVGGYCVRVMQGKLSL